MITFTLKLLKMKKGSAGLYEAFHQTGKEHEVQRKLSSIPITLHLISIGRMDF